jgi:hypothetical protein
MANYSITYSCGHTATKQLYGKTAERERYVAWAAERGACDACRKADKTAACEAVEAEHGLPSLTGSDKQIVWARAIRADKIAAIANWMSAKRPATLTEDQATAFDRQAAAVMQTLYAKDRAGWWIDNRDRDAQSIAKAAFGEVRA